MIVNEPHDPARDVAPGFLERVAGWIEATGEVLVILRYLRAAGAKDYALCRSRHEFELLVNSVPAGTDIVVFRDRQLPIRGVVDAAFMEAALRSIPVGNQYLLLATETEPARGVSRLGDIGNSHSHLQESLVDLMGTEVALGLCPDFWCADHEGLASASKDGIDGPR